MLDMNVMGPALPKSTSAQILTSRGFLLTCCTDHIGNHRTDLTVQHSPRVGEREPSLRHMQKVFGREKTNSHGELSPGSVIDGSQEVPSESDIHTAIFTALEQQNQPCRFLLGPELPDGTPRRAEVRSW